MSDLSAETQRNRLEFLQADLDLCFTFAALVDTELLMEDRAAALRAKAKAEEGHATIARFLIGVDDSPQKQAIERGLDKLRTKLDLLCERFNVPNTG
jgi:hypothetical protein